MISLRRVATSSRPGLGPDEHAAPSVPTHRLGHQLVQPVEHGLGLGGIGAPVGGHRGEERALGQVVGDQVGDVAVHGLVVGDSVAGGVDHDHAALLGHPEHLLADRPAGGIGQVDQLAAEAEVDDIHRPAPHHHPVVPDLDLAGLGQQQADLLGDQAVLVPAGVVGALGEEHHDGVVHRGAGPQGASDERQGVLGLAHGQEVVELGHHLGHQPSDGDGVPDAGGDPGVVLQDPPPVDAVPDQVEPDHRCPGHVVGQQPCLRPPGVTAGEGLLGHDAVTDDGRRPVHVPEVGLEGPGPLGQPGGQDRPLVGRDDPGDRVDGEGPLLAGHPEGEPLGVDPPGPFGQLGRVEALEHRKIGS
jgi:hypothetical protein